MIVINTDKYQDIVRKLAMESTALTILPSSFWVSDAQKQSVRFVNHNQTDCGAQHMEATHQQNYKKIYNYAQNHGNLIAPLTSNDIFHSSIKYNCI